MARNLVQSRPMASQSEQKPTVFIVDDDPAIRFAMQALMDSVNLRHEILPSADEFLALVRLAEEFGRALHRSMGAMAEAVRASTSNIAASLGGAPIDITLAIT